MHRIALLLSALGVACVVHAAPFVPADDARVLEKLPIRPNDPAAAELKGLRAQVASRPGDLGLSTRLARRYIELGRAESDPRYLGYAEAVLAPWAGSPRPPVEVLVLRAMLRQNKHQFDAALTDLTAALEAQPGNAQAWLTRATVHQVRGDFEQARRDCAMLRRFADAVVAAGCYAGAASLNGQLKPSYEFLRETLGRQESASPQVRAWVVGQIAEMAARLGDAKAAEAHFREALALAGQDGYLLGAYADFLLDQGRPGEAAALLRDKTRADGLLLRYALARQAQKAPDFPAQLDQLRARFDAARLRGDSVHLREEARYTLHLLNRPGEALRLAENNWAVQKEPADARLVLEAALAAKDPAAARPVLDWLRLKGTEDVQLARLAARFDAVRS